MSVSKKTKKRIIFWSIFAGVIVIGLIILFVVMNNLINDTNYRIADAIFYSNDGGMQVDEFASAISDAMNGWYCISNFNMDSDEIASYMVDIQGQQVTAYNGRP